MIRKMLIVSSMCLLLTGCMSEQSSKLESRPVTLTKKAEPSEEFVLSSIKVVGIGDSLTKGVGDESNQGGYVGMVREKLEQQENIKEVAVDNYGVRGHKTSNLQKKLKEEEVITSIKNADIILMTIGGNDIMSVVRNNILSLDFKPFRKEQKNYENRFQSILTTVRELNSSAYIVYVGLYNPFKYMLPKLTEIDMIINEWNLATQQMIKQDEKAVYVSVDQLFSMESDERLLYKDEFHPNESGYSLIADKVYDALKKNEIYLDSTGRNE
ncbi:SGNH/GDSL hydrolase family protein [Metabacillus bambusae]|uniref:SGNH/GDSL hydrolase family protein n=1 Tax=Metabacillus bambusae TaxID=2795218 RepID=A0ABS3N1Z8_9BACI|nr:SGNH/GDSL hydrolase family protein [Metabacillus bambusae]MBO1512224.1 SGNH/GDSL hydrolase family protein [Metabacillus bambusae]